MTTERRPQHALMMFLVHLRDDHGVSRDDLGRILLRPTEEPDPDRLDAVMDALGDIVVALERMTGQGMREDLSPAELRAREAVHYVHTAMKRLVPGPGEYDAGAFVPEPQQATEPKRKPAPKVAPPDGWEIVTHGRHVSHRGEPLLLLRRGKWIPAELDSSISGGSPRNRRTLKLTYPISDDVPRWQRSSGRFSVDLIARRKPGQL